MEAAIVARVSNDNGGTSTSPDEQLERCEKAARDHGWHIAGTFTDTESASRFALKDRPEWKRLLEVIRSGAIEVVVMWEPSRGSRELEEWAAFLSLCRKHRVLIHVFTHQRTYDVRVARDWRSLAEDGIDSAYESEKISERSRRAAESRKAEGRPLGRVSLGFRRVHDPATGRLTGQEPDPENAPKVRKLIEMIADGVPVSHAARDAGIRHQSALWLARNPANIGMRPGPDGVLVRAQWEPIVDEATFWRAQEILAGHANAGRRPGASKSLLSHLAACGKCGSTVVFARLKGTELYRCKRGCFAYREPDEADDIVMHAVLDWLQMPGNLEKYDRADSAEAAHARSEAARIRQRITELAESYAAGRITISMLERAEQDLKPLLARAEEQARKMGVPPALQRFAGLKYPRWAAVYEVWCSMPLAAQRELVRTAAEVKIYPQKMAGSRQDQVQVALDLGSHPPPG